MQQAPRTYKICFLADAEGFGGAEIYLLYLADGLSAKGHDCSFIINSANFTFQKAINHKFRVFPLETKSNTYYEARHYPKFYRIVKSIKPDILHYNLPGPYSCTLLAPLVASLSGVKKIVTTEHLPMLQWWRKPAMVKKLGGFFIDSIIAVAKANQGFLSNTHHVPAHKIHVIPNGIDVDFFSFARHESHRQRMRKIYGIGNTEIAIGLIGRLDEQKGHTYALQALKKIHCRFPWIKLIVFGEGTLADSLHNEAKMAGIADKVIFAGFQKEMAPAYACIDLLLMPSIFEGLPLVLLEAMAMERPAIATRIHGIPEVIDDNKNGKLVPPQDIGGLAEAMAYFSARDGGEIITLFGRRARQTIVDGFSLDAMVAKTEKLYSELLGVPAKSCDERCATSAVRHGMSGK